MIPKRQHFLDLAIEIYNYHVTQCKSDSSWTIEMTADALDRSVGSVSQYILLANWSRTHEKMLRRCESVNEALKLARKKKAELNLREIL